MLIQGRYDFTPRKEDSSKTLHFSAGEVLLFLESYPKNGSWLRVAASTGRIGYIPSNYVEALEGPTTTRSRERVLKFLQEAISRAKREKLDHLELELLQDDVSHPTRGIAFMESHTRFLRQALDDKNGEEEEDEDDENDVEIEDGTTYTCDSEYKRGRDAKASFRTSLPSSRWDTSAVQSAAAQEYRPNNYLNKSHPPLSSRNSQSHQVLANKSATLTPRRGQTPAASLRQTPSTSSNLQNLQRNNNNLYSSESSDQQQNHQNCEKMAVKLIKIVQESGGVDEKRSETVVHRILYHLKNHHPSLQQSFSEGISSVLRVLERSPSSSYTHSLHAGDNTGDEQDSSHQSLGSRVKGMVNYLANFGKDYSLHTRGYIEEESVLVRKLDQLRADLSDLDGPGLKRALTSEQGTTIQAIEDLMAFYQADESQGTQIKGRMIEIFSMIVALLDPGTRAVLVKSALPILLGKELMFLAGQDNDDGTKNPGGKLSLLATTLSTLLASSAGKSLPQTHLEALGQSWVNSLLNYVEDTEKARKSPSPNEEINPETTKADFITLLLAYNLQFKARFDENLLIKALAGRPQSRSRSFLAAILNLFESGLDPVRGNDSNDPCDQNHSVLKLLQDMFSSQRTAELFPKSEVKWVVDLLYGNVSGLGPGSWKRTQSLNLLWLVLRNRAIQYRTKDLREALVSILLEEDPLSIPDQRIVKGMSKEFPAIFKKGSGSGINIAEKNVASF